MSNSLSRLETQKAGREKGEGQPAGSMLRTTPRVVPLESVLLSCSYLSSLWAVSCSLPDVSVIRIGVLVVGEKVWCGTVLK